MNNRQYKVFEAPFLAVARPLMEQLRSALQERGFEALSEIVTVDHDVSRGIGFVDTTDDDLYVELMLEDGDAHGYDGVAPVLNCSVFLSGQVWAPENFTENVGITRPEGIVERFQHFDPYEVAHRVALEWDRVRNERSRIREVA